MFATTIWGKGEEVEAVEEVEEVVDDAEVALPWEVVAEVDEVVVSLLCAPCAVVVTVLVTVFVEPDGGGAGWAVDGAKRLLATEAMPAVTNTAPRVMATMRKWRRGFSFDAAAGTFPSSGPSSFDAIGSHPLVGLNYFRGTLTM